MLTKEECLKAVEVLEPGDCWGCDLGCDMNDDRPCIAKEIFEQLINEHFELKEIIKKHGFEKLTNKELNFTITMIKGYAQQYNELYEGHVKRVEKLLFEIEDLKEKLRRDNPPLKFEELKEGQWVWDNKTKSYIYIFMPLNWIPRPGIRYAERIINNSAEGYYRDFEENRFYRYEVKL